MTSKKALIFDMDGVLVDVSKSYRVAIKKTVEFFLGEIIDDQLINEFKNRPELNDDCDCTGAILISKGRQDIREDIIIKKFNEYYRGREFDGLIQEENWLLKEEVIKRLAKKYILTIFTGRPRVEAEFALKLNGMEKYFKMLVCMEDVKNKKPDPEGVLKIIKDLKVTDIFYIGDSYADIETSKKANTKFIGILPHYSGKIELRKIFKDNDAEYILTDVNDLINVL